MRRATDRRRVIQPAELELLRTRLAEAEATLQAIRTGGVDALVVDGPQGERLYTLQTATEPYRVLIEQMNQGAATLSPGGVVLYCNHAFADMLRTPLERMIGCRFATRVVPGDRARLQQLLASGATAREVAEIRLTSKPEPILLRFAASLAGPAGGNICLVATDLTADQKRAIELQDMMNKVLRSQTALEAANEALQREAGERQQADREVRELNTHLEQRVRERTAELETVNKELEAFAYSVSHDLRAPLRSIDGFSRILLRDQAPVLGEQGRAHLERVRAATQQMGLLIDSLLQLSRTARVEFRRTPLDLAALARAVAADLVASNPARRVAWLIAPELPILADAALMRAALDNLLGNAWKFTARRAEAHIECGALERDDERVYFVRDDGAGFDPRYADKLFGAFQRLHTAEEFPGTGIGLATVQRIIHRHGGRVWADGAVGVGATFFFTLPQPGPQT